MSYRISGQIFGLISSFLGAALGGSGCEIPNKNIQLMLELFKGPFMVLLFSYYTLMTFLMMLSIILLSMLMILLSLVSVIKHLICGKTGIGF